MYSLIILFISCTTAAIYEESLYSLACSQVDQTCSLYKIDIDRLNNYAFSNELVKWNKLSIADSFGSVAAFKDGNMSYIILTTDCSYKTYLINITSLNYTMSSKPTKTPCAQPLHSLASRYLLVLGTISNNVGGSYPESLYIFDAISGHWTNDIVNFGGVFSNSYQVLHPQTGYSALNIDTDEPTFYVVLYNLVNDTRHILTVGIETGQWVLKQIGNNLLANFAYSRELNTLVSDCSVGGICRLNLESYQWDLFLPIPNFHNVVDWTFSNDRQTMYFISQSNITIVDLSNKASFSYRVLPLIEQSGNITDINKTVVFDAFE